MSTPARVNLTLPETVPPPGGFTLTLAVNVAGVPTVNDVPSGGASVVVVLALFTVWFTVALDASILAVPA
jgi:hypothetical protein